MTRHRLDLLPLLDVFMVVLFVFATIQEQQLDDSTRSATELEQQVRKLEALQHDRQAQQRLQDRDREARQLVASQQQTAALAEVKDEADHLRGELETMRKAFIESRNETRQDLEKIGAPAEALEHLEVLTKVLDKYSVFEIELVGRTTEDGSIATDCCFRADPLDDQWFECGVVPPRSEERERWLEQGTGGLAEALRRTKGGNAMTLVRQDHAASHRIAARLVEQLRDRFSDQHFYAEEEPVLVNRCITEG